VVSVFKIIQPVGKHFSQVMPAKLSTPGLPCPFWGRADQDKKPARVVQGEYNQMKNTRIALFTLATALIASPLAFGGTINISNTTPGIPNSFVLTGTFTGGVVVNSSGTFTDTNLGGGETDVLADTYTVVPAGTVKSFEGTSGANDNTFVNTANPFTAKGLLILLGGTEDAGDYAYITGLQASQSGEIDVSIWAASTKKVGSYDLVASNNYQITNNDITKTPEPSSLFLLGTGILSLAGLLFWKSKSSVASLPSLSL
jgi:hypothetical protein